MIDFRTHPENYRHWRLEIDGAIATLALDVDENGAIAGDYTLKLNSYDLGVDIELADAVQRLRFEHPEVRAVVLASGKDRVFCAGANISMLATSSHIDKVNFCKFTNETRNAIEDASANSGQRWMTVVAGTAAGGGYELALATDHILLVDDGSTAVSLPEVPLLAVLPAPAGSPASWTSAACAATAPTSSAPPAKACAGAGRWSGTWSTSWCRARASTTPWPPAPPRLPRARTGRRKPAASHCRRSYAP